MKTPKVVHGTAHPAVHLFRAGTHLVATRAPFRAAGALALPAAVVCLLSFPPVAANAAQTRVLQRTFGAAPSDPYPLSEPQGEAIDQATEEVYVVDRGNNRVEKFSASGEFLLMFGEGVNANPLAADRDVCTALETCQAGVAGTGPGAFTTAQYIAVDPESGDVYVGDIGDGVVSKFSPSGVLEKTWGTSGQLNGSTTGLGSFRLIGGVAVGATGTLYVTSSTEEERCEGGGGECKLFEFSPSGGLIKESLTGTGEVGRLGNGLGVNTAGTVFMGRGNLQSFGNITIVTPTGEELGGELVNGQVDAFTVDTATGEVVVAGVDEAGADQIANFAVNGSYEVTEPEGQQPCGLNLAFKGCPSTVSVEIPFTGSGIAEASATGDVYLSNPNKNAVSVYGPLVTIPEVKTEAAVPGGRDLTLQGKVSPSGLPVTKCFFEYGATTSYGKTAECEEPDAAEILAEAPAHANGEVPVHVKVTGLGPNTPYDYRLVAANANDETEPRVGSNEAAATFPPPSIDFATVSSLTSDSATLNAQIKPGDTTHYHFEYDTQSYNGDAAHGVRVPACRAGESIAECEETDPTIPSGTGDVSVSASITGLQASTNTYYWRVIADSESGTTTSSQHSFIYEIASDTLPDGRAYELVTPNRKDGALIGATLFVGLKPEVSTNGLHVTASAIQCFADAGSCHAETGGHVGSPYEFTRTDSAEQCVPAAPPCWHTTPLSLPASEFPSGFAEAYNANEGTAVFNVPTVLPNGQEGVNDFYVREASGEVVDLGPYTPPEDELPDARIEAVYAREATPDFSHFVWEDNYAWASPLRPGAHTLFEYAPGVKGRPLEVGVAGGNDNDENHNLVSTCETTIEGDKAIKSTISADGRIVFFLAAPCGSGAYGEEPQYALFARIDGEQSDAHTVAISEPSAPAPAAPYVGCESAQCIANVNDKVNWSGVHFVGASEDGSNAFFESTQQLTDDATEDSDTADNAHAGAFGTHVCTETVGPNGCNLYEYEGVGSAHPSIVDVSAGEGGASVPGGPRVRGLMGFSPDGSHVYFVALGVLTAKERAGCMAGWLAVGRGPEANCHAVDGANNLYVYDRESHRVAFVAVLPATDAPEWNGSGGGSGRSNVTPNGQFLVFLSGADLTVDDTSQSGARQVFRYDSSTGQLLRMSIGNDGFNDDGNRSRPDVCRTEGTVCLEQDEIVTPELTNTRPDPTMSDDGSRVFFVSPVGLTVHALDDVRIASGTEFSGGFGEEPIYAQNVYEWESEAVGSCPPGRSSGCVFLISDGRDVLANKGASTATCPEGSVVCLIGTDSTGANVFFATADQLVGADTNSELDFYDARICEPENGNPCVTSPPPPPPSCSGEECHGVPAGVPGVPVAPSATFNGAGNVGPAAPAPPAKPKALTRTQKLANALRACRKDKKKINRERCEASARHRYGAVKKAKRVSRNRRGK
jgi:hypothetical protein